MLHLSLFLNSSTSKSRCLLFLLILAIYICRAEVKNQTKCVCVDRFSPRCFLNSLLQSFQYQIACTLLFQFLVVVSKRQWLNVLNIFTHATGSHHSTNFGFRCILLFKNIKKSDYYYFRTILHLMGSHCVRRNWKVLKLNHHLLMCLYAPGFQWQPVLFIVCTSPLYLQYQKWRRHRLLAQNLNCKNELDLLFVLVWFLAIFITRSESFFAVPHLS